MEEVDILRFLYSLQDDPDVRDVVHYSIEKGYRAYDGPKPFTRGLISCVLVAAEKDIQKYVLHSHRSHIRLIAKWLHQQKVPLDLPKGPCT